MYLKLSDKPLCFLDIESSGLDPTINEILDFSASKNGVELSFKIKPRRIHTAHPKALEVNGYTEEEWADAISIEEAAPLISAFLADTIIVGHNVRFDVGFITEFLKEAGITTRFDYHLVDTCTLAYVFLAKDGLESMSLESVCKFIGIPPEPKIHRAINGVRSCIAVYEKLNTYIL